MAENAESRQFPGARPVGRMARGRRGFVSGTVRLVVSGLALGVTEGCESLVAGRRHQETPQDDIAILNNALGLEYQLVAAYRLAGQSRFASDALKVNFRRFGEDHGHHAEGLQRWIKAAGGQPVEPRGARDYGLPDDSWPSAAELLRFLSGLEKGMALTYLGAVPAFADRDLARDSAAILGVETMHWTLLRQALGEDPVPAAFLA
jgi:hypothetical protein